MTALRPRTPWVVAWLWIVVLAPMQGKGRSRDAWLPDGACGNPQAMLAATQQGNALVHQALARSMPWSDHALNEYINRLGQNLAHNSGSQETFSFYVVYNPAVNAQAFPGGYIVINTGAISLADNEAELASVLAHEIAHENACDWRTGFEKANMVELICLVPTVVFGGPVGIALAAGSGWAGNAARARFNRSEEERADRLAAHYLGRSGYDPRAAAQFFARLQVEEERGAGEPHGMLATHPRPSDRQKQLEKIIPGLPPPDFAPHDEAEFLRMRGTVREYDEMYSRIVGVRTPGHAATPPHLSRRPPAA
jgi:beta-barrel assembly-enhancing protease